VWEWCASSFTAYPTQSYQVSEDFTVDDFDVPLQGGGFRDKETFVGNGGRARTHPTYDDNEFGFRLVVAPRP
jgi:formylglycine-generating enzyme required for sulfatase activity